MFGPGVAARVLDLFSSAAGASVEPVFPDLTERERQVLDLLAAGLSTSSIAERLHLSRKTVADHLTAVFAKLQVGSRAEAIVAARERGLGGHP